MLDTARRGERHRVPVTNGYYLFVAWNEPDDARWADDEPADTDPPDW